ncbi:MAG: phosphate signaling complex protein PhoU [Bacteroidetes bacterium]|jgi:phosphate transport system protein|nr:phosphate signaling complex protein PhoU [Bacteroidota bacterium]MBK9320285.1 phosphate signaling complex protein PhoU [Bacteroidota bacterium]
MSHLDSELKNLKSEMLEMFSLVKSQLEKSKDALILLDKDLAREVLVNEKRVNGFELKLDRDCENIIALFNPVAIDLRFVLACMKINSNLERIGDIAEGICQFVLNIKLEPEKSLLETTRMVEMYDTGIIILQDVMEAFDKEDTRLARSVFKKDEILDEINLNANQAVADFIRSNTDRINQSLYLLSTIRKLERVGDQCKNIAEEIIFYIEAKVLKHKSRAQKQDMDNNE